MSRGLFVTGTDTNVGKTVVSAALMCRFRGVVPLCYWKPIQTGIEQDDDTTTVRGLAACPDDEIRNDGVRLHRPVSPHLAAAASGTTIDISPLVETSRTAPSGRAWIVEGAGGVLVPINDEVLMIDMIAAMGLPAVIVSRTTLGTINHTLLTVEAVRRRGIEVAGVVLTGPPEPGARAAIERYGSVPIVGDVLPLAAVTPEAVAAAAKTLDAGNRLLTWLK